MMMGTATTSMMLNAKKNDVAVHPYPNSANASDRQVPCRWRATER